MNEEQLPPDVAEDEGSAFNIAELAKQNFAIEDTEFYISMMPAIPAWRLGVKIINEAGRAGLGNAISVFFDPDRAYDIGEMAEDAVGGQTYSDFLNVLVNGLMSLDENFIEYLRLQTFDKILFRRMNDRQRTPLINHEDQAITDILMVGELIVRALCVFFMGSSQNRVLKRLSQLRTTSQSALSD